MAMLCKPKYNMTVSLYKREHLGTGMMVHACNPSYSRRQKLGGLQFEISPDKKLVRFPATSTNSLGGDETRVLEPRPKHLGTPHVRSGHLP
jgi:hypothetical protein